MNAQPTMIMDNAWIGMHCMILKVVTIGKVAVVATRSVITKDVVPWTIVAGNPASVARQLPVEMRK